MKITLSSEKSIRLDGLSGPLTIEAETPQQVYSPFHMLASSLAVCTHSMLMSWATNAKIHAEDLAIDVSWTFAERPHRVGDISLTFQWRGLPNERIEAAKRVAALCAVHATLEHSPTITMNVHDDATVATS